MSSPLVEASLKSGDLRRAASALVVAYGPDVLATCVAMLRDRVAAEDVTQEVFGEAIRGLSTFRGEASPRTWLLSIARNRCIDHLRARRREPWGPGPEEGDADPDAHPDQAAAGSEWLADRSAVMRALEVLAEGDRALVVLRFKNGLDYGELATAFGLREGTVRMRVSRALARMREVLEQDAPIERAIATPPVPPPRAAPAGPPARPAAAAYGRAPAPAMGVGFGGPPGGAPPPVSWWSRLRAWAGFDDGREPLAPPQPPVERPIGALGVALAGLEPATPSESLARNLAALVDQSV